MRWYRLRRAQPGDGALYEAMFFELRGSGLHPAIAAILAHEQVTLSPRVVGGCPAVATVGVAS